MVDLKKSNAPLTTITRDIRQIDAKTGNIYEAIMIIAARATQIGVDLKKELNEKLAQIQIYGARYNAQQESMVEK